MGWLDRIRTRSEQALDPDEPEGDAPASVERTSPGLAALFAGMKADGRHSILDLGTRTTNNSGSWARTPVRYAS
jgi:hypothetical protein